MTQPVLLRENIYAMDAPVGRKPITSKNVQDVRTIIYYGGKAYETLPGHWQIICTTKGCSEEQAYEITGISKEVGQYEIATVALSFLLESKNLNGPNYIILKKQS